MAKDEPTRFSLIPYRILAKRWRVPALLLIPAGALFFWAAPHALELQISPLFPAVAISGTGILLYIYTILANRAHIQLRSNNFIVQGPIYPVVFSYQRVDLIRPVEFSSLFPPMETKAARRRLYKELWGKTVPTIKLKGLPLPRWWLKLWMHPFLFNPKETGLVVPIDDWMTFNRRLESMRISQRKQAGPRGNSDYFGYH